MDCIGWVEALQNHDPPVRDFFEQENLDTLSQTSGIILFVLAMVAQEESHMKSEAILLSLEWRFSRGRFLTPRLFGYDKIEVPDGFGGKKKVLSVNEAEARAARLGSYIDAGKYRFCSEDFTHDFGIDRKKRVMVATKLQRLGLIVPVGLDGWFYVYAFCTSPGQETDAPVLEEESVSAGFDSFEEEQELDLNGFFGRNPVPLIQKEHPMEVQSAS